MELLKHSKLLVFLVCLSHISSLVQCGQDTMDPGTVELSTNQGKLKGLVKTVPEVSKTYYSFQGIPYAKPPVGNLRFKAPEPFGKWDGVRDALKAGSDCAQQFMFGGKGPKGDEDCLYLNVYTPETGESVRKPVMVWIHGGGFSGGSGSPEEYGPEYLIVHDIVLVTINYRVGALGFLSLENEKVPGNYGLKDQTLALRWVKENIRSFGGDPDNVTIFGESAGSMSVNYHLLSPLSRGLFHKAIMESGFATGQFTFQKQPKMKALEFAKDMGCSSQDPDEVLDFLMAASATEIVTAQGNFKKNITSKESIQDLNLQFLPCVERSGRAPFLPHNPVKMMERGEFTKVPVLFGVNSKEGLMNVVMKPEKRQTINGNLSLLVPLDLNIPRGSEEEEKLGQEIVKFYTNQDTLTEEVLLKFVDFFTDVAFAISESKAREGFLKHSMSPVYSYQMTYISPNAPSSFFLNMAAPEKAAQYASAGVAHADELIHLFKRNRSKSPTSEDKIFMNKMQKAWTNFAKTGNPNDQSIGVMWRPDSLERPFYMELGADWKEIHDISFPKRMEFWKKIYEKYSYAY